MRAVSWQKPYHAVNGNVKWGSPKWHGGPFAFFYRGFLQLRPIFGGNWETRGNQ